ncbi:hypothetical protein OSB04_013751 [Centaurea solstitialis]|uniref:Uncharacterized protein n=1 Tax=Centaurea solstitialis TaxID=347529 RepID=A0AA38TWW6_9ASTR|nr:hypothetical protein OSB04_013751 [Centaurea solstitialis]
MSSWIRSAMHKAAEVPGGAKLLAAVDTVAQHTGYSISEYSKATRNMKSFSDAARMLEEVSVSCKGEQRVQLLKRWLVSLRECERLDGSLVDDDPKSSEDPCTSNDKSTTPEKPTMILYYDPELGRSPMNFRDVFLHSQALEGMTMSMILGAPNEEELFLLHEIFGLCLTGGREVHNVVVKSIQDMAEAFSAYDGEMLARKEELLQFAQSAITGLKVPADIARLDSEISRIQQSLNRMKCQRSAGERGKNSSEAQSLATLKATKESVAHIQLCCSLKSLLQRKRLLKKGDTPETHTQKVEKLQVLLESLHSSVSKTENRILEHREEKKEALSYRVARTTDVSQFEKDLEAEISLLEEQRDKLEAELMTVNNALAAAITRLQNAKEERLQFDEDNNEFLLLLKAKEDELSNTIVSYKAEAETCNAFLNFLEAAWAFQSSYVEQRDKQVNDQLQNHEAYLINVASSFLSTYKDQLEPAIANVRRLWEDLKGYEKTMDPDVEFLQDIRRRVIVEQEYMDAEVKVINIFDAVDSIKEYFYSTIDDTSREDVKVVGELCDAIEKMNRDFKTIKRPNLRIESPPEEEDPQATGSPKGLVLSPGRVMPDFKSIFSQKLLVKSPKQKPYIPLGGLSENQSPFRKSTENDTKPAESEQHKTKLKESEKPLHPEKGAFCVTLESEDEKPRTESDQGETEKISSGLDEERRSLTASENQESKMHQHSALDPVEGNGENLPHSSDGIPKVTLPAEAGTTETVLDKTSQLSDEQPPKSTSRIEEQGEVVPTEEVGVWESIELSNELKDANPSS